jgi:hypothetical protein
MDSSIPQAPLDPTLINPNDLNLVANRELHTWVTDIVDGVIGKWYDETDAAKVLLNFASSMKGVKNLYQAHNSVFIRLALALFKDKSEDPDFSNKFWRILFDSPPPF